MGRPPRAFVPGGIYHVTARGSARGTLFRADMDRVAFLGRLAAVTRCYELRCLAFCLMTNHYHALFQTPDDSLSAGLRDLHGGYARLCRSLYGTDAHVFRNRFGAEHIDSDEYLLTSASYLDLNPVRAGIVARPEEYAWSSYRALAGYDPIPVFLSPQLILSLLGRSPHAARLRYRAFVESRAATKSVSDTAVSDTAWALRTPRSGV